MKALFLRLFALPVAMSLMWVFYSNVGDDAKGFYSKSAMILNILGLAYGAGVWVTLSLCMYNFSFFRSAHCNRIQILRFFLCLVPPWRNRFNQEFDEGLYSGTTLLLAYESVSLPFSIISSAISVCVLYPYESAQFPCENIAKFQNHEQLLKIAAKFMENSPFLLQNNIERKRSGRHGVHLLACVALEQLHFGRTAVHHAAALRPVQGQCGDHRQLHLLRVVGIGQRNGALVQGAPTLAAGEHKGHPHAIRIDAIAQCRLSVAPHELYAGRRCHVSTRVGIPVNGNFCCCFYLKKKNEEIS